MPNCCDDFGNCTQGPGCPVRITILGETKLQRLCSDLGACNLHPDCLDHATCCAAHAAGVAAPPQDPGADEAARKAARQRLLREAGILIAGIAIGAIVSIAAMAAGALHGG